MPDRLTDLEVRQLRDMHADENYTIRSPLCVEVCDELLRLRGDAETIKREAVREFVLEVLACTQYDMIGGVQVIYRDDVERLAAARSVTLESEGGE